MRKILIVVDMQNDFVTGSLGSAEAQAIVPKVIQKIKDQYDMIDESPFHSSVIFTVDTHGDNYLNSLEGQYLPVKHCHARTEGHELIPEIIELIDTKIGVPLAEINKRTFGYEYWKAIIDNIFQSNAIFYPKDNDSFEIELVGLCTDICVVSNALALRMFYPNVKITVDASCCAGVTPEKHAAALEVMKSCQIEVINE
jgi:nicotinamidase-related amidase